MALALLSVRRRVVATSHLGRRHHHRPPPPPQQCRPQVLRGPPRAHYHHHHHHHHHHALGLGGAGMVGLRRRVITCGSGSSRGLSSRPADLVETVAPLGFHTWPKEEPPGPYVAGILRLFMRLPYAAKKVYEERDPGSPYHAETLRTIGTGHHLLGEYDKAVPFLQEALKMQGGGHEVMVEEEAMPVSVREEVLVTRYHLTTALGQLGRVEEAVASMERHLSYTLSLVGTDEDEEVIQVMKDVARARSFAGQYQGKKHMLLRVMDAQRRLYGQGYPEHFRYIGSRLFLASTHMTLGEVQQASDIVDSVMVVVGRRQQHVVADTDHLLRVSCPLLFIKAMLEGELGRMGEKQSLLQQLLAIYDQTAATTATSSATTTTPVVYTCLELASAAAENGQREVARDCLSRAKQVMSTSVLDEGVVQVSSPWWAAALVHGKLGEQEEEERLLQRLVKEGDEEEGGEGVARRIVGMRARTRLMRRRTRGRQEGEEEGRISKVESEVGQMIKALGGGTTLAGLEGGSREEIDGLLNRQRIAYALEDLGENYT